LSSDLSFEVRDWDASSGYGLVRRKFKDHDLRDIDESGISMREMTKPKLLNNPAGNPRHAGVEHKSQGRSRFEGGHGPQVHTKSSHKPAGKPYVGQKKPTGWHMSGPGEFISSGNGVTIDNTVDGSGRIEISTNFL
jgi:hypothetical protein